MFKSQYYRLMLGRTGKYVSLDDTKIRESYACVFRDAANYCTERLDSSKPDWQIQAEKHGWAPKKRGE